MIIIFYLNLSTYDISRGPLISVLSEKTCTFLAIQFFFFLIPRHPADS